MKRTLEGRVESGSQSEWMTLREQATSEVQAALREAGAVETAEVVVTLQALLEQYRDGGNENRFRAEAAAQLLAELLPNPATEYLHAITPSSVSAVSGGVYRAVA